MSWHVDTEVQPDGTVHVWPDDDPVEHDLTGIGCVCGPAVEVWTNAVLVSHASLDGRELTEAR